MVVVVNTQPCTWLAQFGMRTSRVRANYVAASEANAADDFDSKHLPPDMNLHCAVPLASKKPAVVWHASERRRKGTLLVLQVRKVRSAKSA